MVFFISHSSANCKKVELCTKYKPKTKYTYENTVSISTWPKKDPKKITTRKGTYKEIIHPKEFKNKEYSIVKTITGNIDEYIPFILGEKPILFPYTYKQKMCPVGIFRDEDKIPEEIKETECGKIINYNTETYTFDGSIKFEKQILEKINSIESIEINKKRQDITTIGNKIKVTMKGNNLEGTGSETTQKQLFTSTRVLLLESKEFEYEYTSGIEENKQTLILKGKIDKKLIKAEKYISEKTEISNDSSTKNVTRYYSNNKGLFLPVIINGDLETKMYLDTTLNNSKLDFNFYRQSLTKEPENVIDQFKEIEIGGNKIYNPKINLTLFEESNFNIPGTLGNDVLIDSVLHINDKKRTLSIYKGYRLKKPKDAISFSLVNNIPIFDMKVNSTSIKATISFDTKRYQISKSIQENLSIKTLNFKESLEEKDAITLTQDIILDTPDRQYFKTQAVVKNFENEPYDFKLGLDHIKDKEIIIDYKNKWFLIK